MKKTGKYCKAYLLGDLRAYPAWIEKTENARKTDENGKTLFHPRVLTDDSIVYVQENYTVTDDIYMDENVIFDDVTPEWLNYCTQVLRFIVPEDVAAITDAMSTKQA
jgi:hypothetical protein